MAVLKLARELDFEMVKYSTLWVYPKEIMNITNRSRSGVSNIQRSFEEFISNYPNYFEPYFKSDYVILKNPGETTQFNLICFIHYYQNRHKLDVGLEPSRPFKEDIKYIKELLKDEKSH